MHSVKSVFRVILVHVFPAFGLNTESLSFNKVIQSECRKMREKCGPE